MITIYTSPEYSIVHYKTQRRLRLLYIGQLEENTHGHCGEMRPVKVEPELFREHQELLY